MDWQIARGGRLLISLMICKEETITGGDEDCLADACQSAH